jgi:hypothetical protein
MSSKMYSAEVVADSISPEGHRITSVKVIYPHAVHKDMLRHRCMNRNVESFRAQPPEKLIEALRNGHAFEPDVFAQRVKGMGQGEPLHDALRAQYLWREHLTNSVTIAEEFLQMGIAKQQVNFLLQDLCPLTEIITATDWSNFYALRTELRDDGTPMARPEVYKTAKAIKDAIEASHPIQLSYGDLHLPMLTTEDLKEKIQRGFSGYPSESFEIEGYWVYISAGRCARISYGEFDWQNEPRDVSFKRAEKLLQSGHMSPFEQQAKPFSKGRWDAITRLQTMTVDRITSVELEDRERKEIFRQLEYSGNLHGWVPARKTFENEHDYGLMRAGC